MEKAHMDEGKDMHKALDQYKAVFFDVGDTLLTIPGAREIIQQFLAERSIHRDKEHIGELFNDAFRRFYYGKKTEAYEECTPESDRVFWIGLYSFIMEHLGAAEHASEDQIHHWCHELYDIFTSPEHYQLFEDVKETLARLKEKGFGLGLISNFAPTLSNILEKKGILSHFDLVIVSTEVGLEKPNPAIFQLALDRSGYQAEDILYIGDHEKNDIWAPNQAGIDAVKIKRYDYHTGEGIHSLRELFSNTEQI